LYHSYVKQHCGFVAASVSEHAFFAFLLPSACGAVCDVVMAAWLHPHKPYHMFQEVKVRPDAAVWNALIAAAGRAGQLQRAFEALQDMQVQPRLCSDSNTLRASSVVSSLFLCILLASRRKHALSLRST